MFQDKIVSDLNIKHCTSVRFEDFGDEYYIVEYAGVDLRGCKGPWLFSETNTAHSALIHDVLLALHYAHTRLTHLAIH